MIQNLLSFLAFSLRVQSWRGQETSNRYSASSRCGDEGLGLGFWVEGGEGEGGLGEVRRGFWAGVKILNGVLVWVCM